MLSCGLSDGPTNCWVGLGPNGNIIIIIIIMIIIITIIIIHIYLYTYITEGRRRLSVCSLSPTFSSFCCVLILCQKWLICWNHSYFIGHHLFAFSSSIFYICCWRAAVEAFAGKSSSPFCTIIFLLCKILNSHWLNLLI